MRQSSPLVWVTNGNDRRAQLPEPPEGQYLAWSCVNEAAETVDYEFAEIPPPEPEPEPEPEPVADPDQAE